LDGLNKNMQEWDSKYYLSILQQTCQAQGLRQLAYPLRRFIAQVARFDPSKGIPVVLKSYAKLRRHQLQNVRKNQHPQLIICGHGSIDDPDGSKMYGLTMETIHSQFQDLEEDIIVIRLGPSDQILNTILSMATVVLQLSSREGFEVKVSEALHKVSSPTSRICLQLSPCFSCKMTYQRDTGKASHCHKSGRHSTANRARSKRLSC
jgi:alpha,alpha-trehalose phosphorylase (configuration-retaining)